MRVFVVAIEPSADQLGADLLLALRARAPSLEVSGVGGPAMAAQGVASLFDPAPLAIVGLTEVLRVAPLALKRARETAQAAIAFRPDAAVLIDAWGFTTEVARRLRRAGADFPLIKFIGPQVWAARPGRAKKVAALYDRLIAALEIERPFYEGLGLSVDVCGLPALEAKRAGDGAAFRARHALHGRVLLLAPGSRASEIERVAPTLEAAAAALCAARADLTVVCVVAPAVRPALEARARDWPFPHQLILEVSEKEDAFAAADAAIAASGTVTTEIARQGTPVVVGYRVGALTAAIMRRLFIARYITLMNIAADRVVAPEFVQDAFTAEAIAGAAAPLLDDPAARERQVTAQHEALRKLAGSDRPAADIAAESVLAAVAPRTTGPQPRSASGT